MDTWKVNSYSYPNPFQQSGPAKGAWEMFESFLKEESYSSVKAHWEGNQDGRRLSAHSVESWKATFEEFGLLFVLSGSDQIHITPGGLQLAAAAAAQDENEFAWVGINLLLRYPLRGKTRRSRGDAFDQSDLLLYWFVFIGLLELNGFTQSELNRVLCKTFRQSEAVTSLFLISQLRNQKRDISEFPDPTGETLGGVYNAINQVMVHGSLNHMLFTSFRESSSYIKDKIENRWALNPKFKTLIELALGGQALALPSGCGVAVPLIQRMPAAPIFEDEELYFQYLGASVIPLALAQQDAISSSLTPKEVEGEIVFFLSNGIHFERIDNQNISGPIHILCQLMPGQRVIVSDDLANTFIVEGKELNAAGQVTVRVRRARRITNAAYIKSLL